MDESDTKSGIPMLDLYESYREWITDNATGCELDMSGFAKKIKDVFPDALVKDGVVKGIAQRLGESCRQYRPNHRSSGILRGC
jgi:hypothetical protein